MNVVRKTFTKRDGSRRAEIFERPDGTFGFEEFTYGKEEGAWFPFGKYSTAIIDSMNHATSEAVSRIAWLSLEAEQIVGRERRERGSQLTWCGEGCFDSRRRVNSAVRHGETFHAF